MVVSSPAYDVNVRASFGGYHTAEGDRAKGAGAGSITDAGAECAECAEVNIRCGDGE